MFDYSKLCPFVGNDNSFIGITDNDILASGVKPQQHQWYTNDETIHWENSNFSSSGYFGYVHAFCIKCGAKTTAVHFAWNLTEQEKAEFDKQYSKYNFNSGEFMKMLNIPTNTLFGLPIVNILLKNGTYSSDDYVPDYCLKSSDFWKNHLWHTDQRSLYWYGEPCGDSPLVEGFCLLCGAKSDYLVIDYPLHNEEKIKEWKENYSKEKFNNGEYSIRCWGLL